MRVLHLNQRKFLTDLFLWVKGRDVLFSDFTDMDAAGKQGRILLRHDVDDDIGRSLNMAELQHDCGVKATYFILDTAPYWKPDDKYMWMRLEAIRQMGHEIAWHNNVLSEWVNSLPSPLPVGVMIRQKLDIFKNNGFVIRGSASHGDKLCYKYGFINYEVFEECARTDFDSGFTKKTIDHPVVKMSDFGLKYEAYHLPRDQYFSESGGTWKVLPAASHFENKEFITQILIHPQWWTL